MNVLAVDTGYSATKIYSETKSGRKTLIFPSVIGQTEFGEDFLGTTQDNFIAELSLYPGKVRNYGETAIRLNRGGEVSADRDMFTKHYNPALTVAGIAKFMMDKETPAPNILVVGLPVNFYASQKQTLIDKLQGKHTVKLYKINGQLAHTVEFTLDEILVLPQGYGSYLSYALDRDGKKIAERIVPTAVIDGGECPNPSPLRLTPSTTICSARLTPATTTISNAAPLNNTSAARRPISHRTASRLTWKRCANRF
jgi:hypothetical protein